MMDAIGCPTSYLFSFGLNRMPVMANEFDLADLCGVHLLIKICVCSAVHGCVRACVHACVLGCVRACVRACLRAGLRCVCV